MSNKVDKILKLQALAKSNNKHEATLAVKKAHELLMELYSTSNVARNSVDFNSIDITT